MTALVFYLVNSYFEIFADVQSVKLITSNNSCLYIKFDILEVNVII